ncbi:MAG: hypothetical protein RJB66_1414 [Pseudomonadota bacterium]|jgi:hypothetical protein
MKRRVFNNLKSQLFLLLTVSTFGLSSYAEKMSLEAHDLVISKLESSLQLLKRKDQAVDGLGLQLQLANLYADKARLLLVEEGRKGCDGCLESKQFRKKAIGLYELVLPQLVGGDHDHIALQLAHLYETTEKNKQALTIYNSLIQNQKTNTKTVAIAFSKRASTQFREGSFDEAIADFNKVLKNTPDDGQGPIHHKLAWAFYNKGEVDRAIAKLFLVLKNEEYLQQATDDGFQYSESFHSEVAHDLALFMAKDNITENSIDELIAVSPKQDIVNNLLFLGDEAERVGQTKGAPLAWERALSMDDFPDHKKLPALLSIARYHRDQFNFAKTKELYGQAVDFAKKTKGGFFNREKCDNRCEEQIKTLKQFLVQWEKRAIKLSSPHQVRTSQLALLEVYEIYHQFQPKDYETQLWLAQLSQKLNQLGPALKAYARAADLLAETKDKDGSKAKIIDSALLEEIKIAETHDGQNEKMAAYNHYLSLRPSGPHKNQVRYQRAKLLYDKNEFSAALIEFDEMVHDTAFTNQELKIKAANLALDSLVLLKDVETLEAKSLEYANLFPRQAAQFHKIARNAGTELVTTIAKKEDSSAAAEKALKKLESVTLNGVDSKGLQSHYRMKIDLALKAQKWDIAHRAINQYLGLKGLMEADRRWALTKQLSLSELLLDFKSAYSTVVQLNYFRSPSPQDLLKGALLAELSAENSVPWLEKVVESKKSSKQQVALARAQLVRLSKNPWKRLHKEAKHLASSKNIFADLALECFDRDNDLSEAQWVLSQPGIRNTDSAMTLQRILTLAELQEKAQLTKRMKLNSRTDALLTSSLKNRMKALSEMKRFFRSAQKQQDWTLQVVAASLLKNENLRLGAEIEALPLPKKLNPREKQAYQQELVVQAKPFKQAAKELEGFLEESWKDSSYVDLLLRRIDANDRIHSVLMNELRSLAAFAPRSAVDKIQLTLSEFKSRPTQREVSKTKANLRQDPFDLELQNRLLTMERKLGNQSMVVFLRARSNSIKAGEL